MKQKPSIISILRILIHQSDSICKSILNLNGISCFMFNKCTTISRMSYIRTSNMEHETWRNVICYKIDIIQNHSASQKPCPNNAALNIEIDGFFSLLTQVNSKAPKLICYAVFGTLCTSYMWICGLALSSPIDLCLKIRLHVRMSKVSIISNLATDL